MNEAELLYREANNIGVRLADAFDEETPIGKVIREPDQLGRTYAVDWPIAVRL